MNQEVPKIAPQAKKKFLEVAEKLIAAQKQKNEEKAKKTAKNKNKK